MRDNTPPHKPLIESENLEDFLEEGDEEIHFLDDEEFDRLAEGNDDDDDEEFQGFEIDDETNSRKPERDDSILTFTKHSGPVFCCSMHPQLNICATGGEDDKAYVWNTLTGEILHEISNHKDTVITASFSYDGNYLATGDMAGEIQVFRLSSNDLKKVWEFSMGDMCWLKWHTATNVLMGGSDSGEIYVWRIPSGECKVLPGNGRKCETAELSSDGKKLFAGYGDGIVKLWDIKNCSVIVEASHHDPNSAHSGGSIASVSCDPDKSLYLSGSEDGTTLLISNTGPVCTLHQCSSTIETVAFCPDSGDLKLAATGTLDGQIFIWDIPQQCLRMTCERPEPYNDKDGVTVLQWLPQMTLICGMISGNIYGFDGRSGTHKFSLLGHTAEIYNMHYNSRENMLITASEDSTVKIFKVNV